MNLRDLGFRKVDGLILGWVFSVVVLVAFARHRIDHSAEIIVRHATYGVAYLAGVRLLARLQAREMAQLWFRFGAIVAFFFVTFFGLADIIRGLHSRTYELELLAADRSLFGTDPVLALEAWLHPLAVDLFEAAYFSYFVTPLIVFGVLVARRDAEAIDRLYVAVLLTVISSYIGYLLVPARSPYVAAQDPSLSDAFRYTVEVRGLWIGDFLRTTIDSWDTLKLNAFPSGHAAIAMMFIWLFRRDRTLRFLVLPAYSLLIISTIYLRYHFVVDVLVGVALGLTTAITAERWMGAPAVTNGSLRGPGRWAPEENAG